MTDKLICPYCEQEYVFDGFSDDGLEFESEEQIAICKHCNSEFLFDTTSTIHFKNVCKKEVNDD